MKCMLSLFAVVLLLGFAVCCQAQAPDAVPQHSLEGSTQIKLTIGNIIVPAVLYNNPTARNLLAKLPVTVSLNRYERDYCGGIIPLHYEEKDLHSGYHNGELAYWPTGQDFVIFVEKEESSLSESPTVTFGEVSSDIKEVRDFENHSIKVTMAVDK